MTNSQRRVKDSSKTRLLSSQKLCCFLYPLENITRVSFPESAGSAQQHPQFYQTVKVRTKYDSPTSSLYCLCCIVSFIITHLNHLTICTVALYYHCLVLVSRLQVIFFLFHLILLYTIIPLSENVMDWVSLCVIIVVYLYCVSSWVLLKQTDIFQVLHCSKSCTLLKFLFCLQIFA